MESKMRTVAKNSRNFIGRTIAVFGAAVAVSAAVRSHRKPSKDDLEILGIERSAFDQVKL
jgi:hypothetical protein